MDFGEEAARADAAALAGRSDTTEGVCTAVSWTDKLATISLGGAAQRMKWAGPAPFIGDIVRVVYGGQKPFCMSVYGSPIGTVASVAGNLATVAGDDGRTYVYPFKNGDTYSSGQRVRLDHAGQLVSARYSQDPLALVPLIAAGPPTGPGSGLFRPIDSGNFRFGAYMGQDVQVNSNRSGAYWYGTQIADTIPDTATITRAEISLTELFDNLPGVPSLLGTHNQATRGAEPAITGVIPIYDGGTVNISAIANALKTGAGLGVGFQIDTGYRSFGSAAESGAIYMEWT